MRTRVLLCGIALSVIFAPLAVAQWTAVGNGIDYREYTLSDPNNVFVARMDVTNTNAFIESSIAQGRLSGGTEVVSSQATRYDDAIGYWGQVWGNRNDVVIAINGSYFDGYGVPVSGVVHSGWYDKRFDNVSGMSGFGWTLNRAAFIGECVSHYAYKQLITYVSDGSVTQQFQGVNVAPGDNQITIFTPQYDADTGTDSTVTEVLVEMSRPAMLIATPNMCTGTVKQIIQSTGSTQIPFDHVVLSAKGTAATTLLNYATVGDTIGISQEIRSLESDCSTARTLDWTKTYGSISSNWVFLRNSVIQYGIDSTGERHPRTAIALDASYVYFIVCDGRSTQSIGMTIDELAVFCKNTLGATWGCNQDGGGSSTMVVNGTVMNDPSDGSQRAVSNGMLMCNLVAKSQTTTFNTDDTVETTASANVFLGPGTNYAVITAVSSGTQGTVLAHNLNGVRAKGYNWWKVDFSGTVGWVAESLLSAAPEPSAFCFTNNDVETFTSGVATDWTSSGSSATYSASTDSYSGTYSQKILWTSSGAKASAIYQQLWVEVGVQYSVTAYFRMNNTTRINGMIRVDYNGGTNPSVYNIGCSAPRAEWGSKTLTFTKSSGEDGWATVFVGGYSSSAQANDWCLVDLVTPACGAGPTITQQPSAQNLCAGATATFSVTASGTGTLTYQWQRNQIDLSNGGDISGATTSSLQIANVESADAGSYRCVVTDNNGSTNSNSAALTLKDATAITTHPTNQEVDAGQTAQFTVTATGEGTQTYQWQKDQSNLSNGGDISGATTATLSIANAEAADEGSYRCVVTADCGTVNSDGATLTIVYLPVITQQPSPQDVCAGATATFNVTATGTGTLTYQWQKNQINLSNGGDISGATTSSLQIANVESADAGNYRCVVTDDNGSTNSNSAALTLKDATAITTHPTNQEVNAGQTAQFTVTATGEGTLTYQWQKNQSNLSNGGDISGATTATLSIANAEVADEGNYRCVVTGACGSVTSNEATLTVNACSPPSLLNASFEGGNTGGVATYWTGYQRYPYPSTTDWSIQTASPPPGAGYQYQQIANTTATGGGGVRQNITGCVVGQSYTISGWMRTNSTVATCTVKCSPTASTSWDTAIDLSPSQSTTSTSWVYFSGTVTATGTSMTLWLDGHTGGTNKYKACCFDGVTVNCTP